MDAKVTTNGANENTGARVNANLHNIVDTLWKHAGSVDVGTCLFVNATTGDDVTGVRGRMDKMYETLDAAYAASVAGDVIVIFDAGTYTFNNDVTKDLNLYAPLATINPQGGSSSSLLLAVNDLNVTIECNVFDGPIAQDSGVTGGVLTLTVKDCTDNIEAETVLIYGGNIQGSVTSGSDGYCAIQGATVNLDITGIDISLYNSVCESALKPLNGGSAGLSNSRANRVEPVSGTASIVSIGSHVNIPPGPSITSSSIESSVGFSPLLTASFNITLTDTAPGAGKWGVDADAFADITYLRVDLSDYNGNDITDYLDSLGAGRLEMRTLDYSKRMLFDVTSVTTATGYRKINVTPVLGAFPEDGEFYTFDFREAGGGSTPQTLADTLIEGQETSGRSIIISEFDGINFEQGVNQVRLKAPATATGSRTQTLQDKDGVIALVSDFNVGVFTMFIEAGADKDYTLDAYAAFGYTINSLAIKTGSGTCNATVKINGTAVTGISGIGVTSSVGVSTASGANTVTAGQRVIVTIDTTAAATDIELTMKYTRS